MTNKEITNQTYYLCNIIQYKTMKVQAIYSDFLITYGKLIIYLQSALNSVYISLDFP